MSDIVVCQRFERVIGLQMRLKDVEYISSEGFVFKPTGVKVLQPFGNIQGPCETIRITAPFTTFSILHDIEGVSRL